MTKQECAVIEAYTGTCMLQGKDREFFYEYVEDLLGKPITKSQIAMLSEEIQRKAKPDFIHICENAFDIEEAIGGLLDFLNDEDDDDIHSGFAFGDFMDEDEEDDDDEETKEIFGYSRGNKSGIPDCELYGDGDFDPVQKPKHYQTKSGIEAIDVIEAFTEDLDGIEAVCTGNILKYMCRWNQKNGLEDLKKAKWYLEKLIEEVEND